MEIFIIRNGIKLGPYTATEINMHLRSRVFSESDVARYEGSQALWPLLAVPGVEYPHNLKPRLAPSPQTPTTFQALNAWTASLRRWVSVIALFVFVGLALYKHVNGTREAPGTEGSFESPSLTRGEWRRKLRDNFAIPSGHQLLANERKFLAVMGKPDDVQHDGQNTFWTYTCMDGLVQLAFQVDPDLTGGQIIAEVSDE